MRWWHRLVLGVVALSVTGIAVAKDRDRPAWDDDQTRDLPPITLKGYFRFRGDLFHNFDLGYTDRVAYQRERFTSFFTPFSERNPNTSITGLDPSRAQATNNGGDSQGTASIRFRLEPTIHVSENIRIHAQFDIFDNLVLGSTPEGFPNSSGFAPVVGLTPGAVPPSDRVNSLRDSIRAKRAWGEVDTPFGRISFGRMPLHWGMGILFNDGNCLDCDYGDTFDRFMLDTKAAGFKFTVALDWASEGLTSDILQFVDLYQRGASGGIIDRYLGRPFDADQRDDVTQWSISATRSDPEHVEAARLAAGKLVLNYGFMALFRNQGWTSENRSYATFGNAYQGRLDTPDLARQPLFERRGMRAWVLDPWVRLKFKKMTFDAEVSLMLGTVDNSGVDNTNVDLFQFGAALRFSYLFLKDSLKFTFDAGVASGSNVEGVGVRDTLLGAADTRTGLRQMLPRIANFKFDPDFQLDRILWREVVGAVTDAWYIKPSVRYSITSGLGVKFSTIYSQAVRSMQWPGQSAPLGLEFNLDLYYRYEKFLYASMGYAALVPFSGLSDATNRVDATLAQALYMRIVIFY